MENIGRSLKNTLKFVGIIWIVFAIEIISPFDLTSLGIRPREVFGLIGILFSPFLHSSLGHIISNSIPLLVLLVISYSLSEEMTNKAIGLIIIISGLGTWFFGTTNSVHVGASSVVMGLIGFLLFLGFYRRNLPAIMVSIGMFVAVMIFHLPVLENLMPHDGISWTGHFFGFIAGIVAARQNGQEKYRSAI
jgi:membrane associated rhomboid family serine protease